MQPGLLTQAFANDGNIEEDSHDDGHDDDHVDKEGKQMAARSALGLARASLLLPTPSLPFLTSGKFLMGKIVNTGSTLLHYISFEIWVVKYRSTLPKDNTEII